jgi:predicted DNA-binding protein YlxM (UPF0122 family)
MLLHIQDEKYKGSLRWAMKELGVKWVTPLRHRQGYLVDFYEFYNYIFVSDFLSFDEIAKELKVSRNTVMTDYKNAIKKLAKDERLRELLRDMSLDAHEN